MALYSEGLISKIPFENTQIEIYLDGIKSIGQINKPIGFTPETPVARNAKWINYSSQVCPTVTVAMRLR